MACKHGCPKRCREAARRAGWYLVAEGEWAGWWEHPELTPYRERRFRDEDVDKNPTAVAVQRPSIRREMFGVIRDDISEKIKPGLDAFIKRLQGNP